MYIFLYTPYSNIVANNNHPIVSTGPVWGTLVITFLTGVFGSGVTVVLGVATSCSSALHSKRKSTPT
jgi:hypothetical protein